MKLSTIHFTALSSVLASIMVVACGGSQAEPETPATPPPPPPAQTAAPVAQSTAAATAAPAPAPVEPAPAPAPEKKTPPQVKMLFSAIAELKLTAEQKPQVDAIEADMVTANEVPGELRAQLTADIADGATAGKLDKAKTGKDVKALEAAATESVAKIQDTANRLHKVLDAAQRKQLAESMQAKHAEMEKEMEEHAAGKGPEGAGPPGQKDMKPGAAEGHSGAPGQMEGHGHMGMMGHGNMLDMVADKLGLAPEQKDKLQKKLEAEDKADGAKMKAHMKDMGKKNKAIGDAFQTDKFDAKKAGIAAEHPKMVKEMAEKRIRFVEAVLSVLKPDQRAKFGEHIRAHAAEEGEPAAPAAAAAPEKSGKAEKAEMKADKAEKAEAKAEMKADKAEMKAEKAEKKAEKAEKAEAKADEKAEKAETKAEKKADKAEKAEKAEKKK